MTFHQIRVLVLAWASVGCQSSPPKQGAAIPPGPVWPVPAGWAHETFALPPAFAPELPYHGMEELRFMPGFYTPGADDFWSYTLVWWLEQPPTFDSATVSQTLTAYFRGLAAAVGGTKYQFDPAHFHSVLSPVSGAATPRLSGQIFTYDPFKTGEPVTLNVEAELQRCPAVSRTAIVVMLSPKPPTHTLWTQLRGAAAALECP
jgi:hypothetical protein